MVPFFIDRPTTVRLSNEISNVDSLGKKFSMARISFERGLFFFNALYRANKIQESVMHIS